MQNYALFLISRCIISFFFNNFAPCKRKKVKNLTIDIGNTCIKMVAFDGMKPLEEMRVDEGEQYKLRAFCLRHAFGRGIFSTVVDLSEEMREAIGGLPFPMMQLVSGLTPIPIVNGYKTPETLGADRLAAAIGAWSKQRGHDVLVIDVGTCITYDFVSASGVYLGGNISPGPTVRLKALNLFTDSLPLVSRKGRMPQLGDCTETAIRCGVMQGIAYEIEGYICEYQKKYPGLFIYLTGGVHLNLQISEKKCIFADNYIVPEGLNRVLIYNEEIKAK